MSRTTYRIPSRRRWQERCVCDTLPPKGPHCGECDPCLAAKEYFAELYIRRLIDECRALNRERDEAEAALAAVLFQRSK